MQRGSRHSRSATKTPLSQRNEAFFTHDARNAFLTDTLAASLDFAMDARASVRFSAACVGLRDIGRQSLVLYRS